MTAKRYLLSLPERVVRSVSGLGAGLVREASEIALPDRLRKTQLYSNLVDTTLRILIEQVGGVEGVYQKEGAVTGDLLVRRTAGNVIEALGIVAFRASPVWVLAAMAAALKEQGLLEKDAEFTSVDQMLDGLERTSGRLAATINAPPLDVAALRQEWGEIRESASRLKPDQLPSAEMVMNVWQQLRTEAAKQEQSVFETSSMMAMAAVRGLPDGVRWLSASARVAATRTGQVMAAALLDHYRTTLAEIGEAGYATYASRQLGPYVRAAIGHFSPSRRTLTERLLDRGRSENQ
jgi:hypothetical protein